MKLFDAIRRIFGMTSKKKESKSQIDSIPVTFASKDTSKEGVSKNDYTKDAINNDFHKSPSIEIKSVEVETKADIRPMPLSEPSKPHYNVKPTIDVPASSSKKSDLDSNISKDIVESPQKDETDLFTKQAIEEEKRKKAWIDFLLTKRKKQIKELEKLLAKLEERLAAIQDNLEAIKEERSSLTKTVYEGFQLSYEQNTTIKAVNVFKPFKYEEIMSVSDYEKQREEERTKKIRKAEKMAEEAIDAISEAISNRDLQKSIEGINIICQQVSYIENSTLRDRIKEMVMAVNILKQDIEEEKRKKIEQKRRAEAIAAKEESERIEREQQIIETQKNADEEEHKQRNDNYLENLRLKANAEKEENDRLNNLRSAIKDDGREIMAYLNENGVQYLYHYTDEANIPLIKSRRGLYSWAYLISHNKKIACFGGDSIAHGLDRDKGLEDYVRLSFCKVHPMAYDLYQRNRNHNRIVLLKIKTGVTAFDSTIFSNINATDKKALIGSDLGFIQNNIDLKATLQLWKQGIKPKSRKMLAEILVKTYIPLEYIVNIDNPEAISFS